jgi:hypothetical protein
LTAVKAKTQHTKTYVTQKSYSKKALQNNKCLHWKKKKEPGAKHWWLTPIILATQKAEMRITVQSQPWQIVHETLSQKISNTKKELGVAQVEEHLPSKKKKRKKKKGSNKQPNFIPFIPCGTKNKNK